ncbi:MAG TPA: molybdopterin-synthase adenylyltransferase MoeB [Opitutaceae bacterium]|jgi:molybdopterin/thiamine biosynthesis adenylyltransferase/rhodanese-related sulfurtransferase|nr:molybdopterin-synthase adenylyltransferase MoeB [Opitutaceae bacterium]
MPFSPDELARYQRHLSLAGFGPEAQEKLQHGSVLVIGAGGLGCPALLYLAAAGVGRIVIIDDDRVDVSNLQRQVLYATADAGASKADAAARRLRALNPLIKVEARGERFARANALELVRGVDVVLDGSDNFATRYLVNDACVLAGKPFVYGAIQGFAGQLSVFNWRGGPTYRCLFPEPPAPGTVPNCAEAGVLGVLPGLIGTAQACEVIKLLTGIGEPLSGRLLLWDALTMTTQCVTLAADPRSRAIRELPSEGYGKTCDLPEMNNKEIDIAALREELGHGSAPQLLDVREAWERVRGAIEPSVHVPLGELEKGAAAALSVLDPSVPTVVYCAGGVRSLRGAELLIERHGFRHAVSLRGGYQAWVKVNAV